MALMHRFHICEGSVTYNSRFLQSDSYVSNSEKNRIVVSEFGTVATPDPCKSIFARFFSRFQTPSMCALLFKITFWCETHSTSTKQCFRKVTLKGCSFFNIPCGDGNTSDAETSRGLSFAKLHRGFYCMTPKCTNMSNKQGRVKLQGLKRIIIMQFDNSDK